MRHKTQHRICTPWPEVATAQENSSVQASSMGIQASLQPESFRSAAIIGLGSVLLILFAMCKYRSRNHRVYPSTTAERKPLIPRGLRDRY